MPATASPQGFIPAKHPSGIIRPAAAVPDGIASGYGTAIYAGMPVILDTNGTLIAGTAAADLAGIFSGCEYDPADNGPRKYSNQWPASATYIAGSMVAYYHRFDDAALLYWVQSNAIAYAASAVGDQADVANVGNGNSLTGYSTCSLGALVGVGVQGQFRIMELALDQDNAWGDAYVNVLVQVARSQFISNKVAV